MTQDATPFVVNKRVRFRGRYASTFSLRGVVEVIGKEGIGIRLDNGNFAWAFPDQLRPDWRYPD